MILANKDQCRSCQEYGRVKGLDCFCCFGVDVNGKVHCEILPQRSNCWCLDMKPNGRNLRMTDWHILGKKYTERYGKNVILKPVDDDGNAVASVYGKTRFRIEVESPRLTLPVTVLFSIKPENDMYTEQDAEKIIRAHEKTEEKQWTQ